MDKKDVRVGTGLVGAPACGDVMKLQIKVDADNKIIDAKFKTFGCGSAIASSSLVTEMVRKFKHTYTCIYIYVCFYYYYIYIVFIISILGHVYGLYTYMCIFRVVVIIIIVFIISILGHVYG